MRFSQGARPMTGAARRMFAQGETAIQRKFLPAVIDGDDQRRNPRLRPAAALG
jgi:hypothetical protein